MKVQSQFIEMAGDLPKNGTLSDYCEMKAGKSIKSDSINSQYNDGLYPCYGGNGLRGYVETYSHDGVYNIIGRQGALCGNITLTKGKFYATEHAIVVRPKTPINEYWLYFALAQMNLNQYARGVAQPGLAVKQLEKLPFGISSKGKQEKFAAVYQQADKSKFVGFKSQFIEMFGDPYTGWKYPTERLGEVYNIGTGGTPDRKVYGYYEGQIPWVKSTEVSYCELYDTEEHISEQAIKDSNCSLYPSGTILLAMYGQGTTRGRVAQLRTDAAVNQAIAAIQVQDETESLFLYSMLKVCYDYLRNLAVGGNQHNLNLKLVSSIPLIVPPKELQLKFVSIAKQADKSKYFKLTA